MCLLIACHVCAVLGFTWLYLAISMRLNVEDVCGSAVRAVVNDKATTIGSIGGSMAEARAVALPATAPAAAAGRALSLSLGMPSSSVSLRTPLRTLCLCSDALLLSSHIGVAAFLLLLSSHIGLAAFFLRCCFLLT